MWGDDPVALSRGLIVNEKSVPSADEDTATIAVTAARYALARAQIDPQKIGAIYVGSESHPYAVKPSATIVAEAINATPVLTAADLEFACKAGTAGIQMTMGLVDSNMIEYGLAIGADTFSRCTWRCIRIHWHLLEVQHILLVKITLLLILKKHTVLLLILLIFIEGKDKTIHLTVAVSLENQHTLNMY